MGKSIDELLNPPVPPVSPAHSRSAGHLPAAPAASDGAGGHTITYRHEDVAALGDRLERQVGDFLKQARYKLNGDPRTVSTGAFTTFAYPLAMTYTEAVAFEDQDLRTKMQALMHVNDLLHKTAANQSEAERKSTVREK
jgi:hypothetical protein